MMLLEIARINLKIINSRNFIHVPLSAFLKTFGIAEFKQDYFPRLFNTKKKREFSHPAKK